MTCSLSLHHWFHLPVLFSSLRMEALDLPHLSQPPHEALLGHAQKVVARFETCQIHLRSGSLRIAPLSPSSVAIEGVSSKGNRRFLLVVEPTSWRLVPRKGSDDFHQKLGSGDAPLIFLTQAISEAFRAGRIEKISNEYSAALLTEIFPKPLIARGDDRPGIERDPDVIAAWMTVDSILQSPTSSKRLERAIAGQDGTISSHLLITYQEPKKRFILERWPFPRPFDSRPGESITLTKDTISHFDPDGPEPFSSKERSLEVFDTWLSLWKTGGHSS